MLSFDLTFHPARVLKLLSSVMIHTHYNISMTQGSIVDKYRIKVDKGYIVNAIQQFVCSTPMSSDYIVLIAMTGCAGAN